MFLHIGGNMVVPIKKIVGIFDYISNDNKITNEFLKSKEEKELIVLVDSSGLRKSFIVTEKEIYLSPIATSTLKKRAKLGFNSREFVKI